MGSPVLSGYAEGWACWGQGREVGCGAAAWSGPLLALATQGSRGVLGPSGEKRSDLGSKSRGQPGLGRGTSEGTVTRRLSYPRGSQDCTGSEIRPQHGISHTVCRASATSQARAT